MTIKILNVVKAGTTEVLLRVPQVKVADDGTLWAGRNNEMPLLNGSGSDLSKDELAALVRARDYSAIPAGAYLRMGVNIGGKEALSQEDVDARAKDQMTPAEKARVAELRERARKARDWDNLYNEGAEGYNPYRDSYEAPDNTPYHKGDDQP